MNKFSNLGIEGFEKIFSSDKLSQGSKLQSITTLALLAEAVSDSQAKCAALITESSNSESSQMVFLWNLLLRVLRTQWACQQLH
ncbi:hypothetical protein V6Z11_D11G341300 [Gossypium hirsutum]